VVGPWGGLPVDRIQWCKCSALAAQPGPQAGAGPAVSRASLQADLLAANARCVRLAHQVRHLEQRLTDALGERVWREAGIGAPTDVEQLQARITTLEQQVVDLRLQLGERSEELDAARTANRELTKQLNQRPSP
jgi:outer membrane protein TolC